MSLSQRLANLVPDLSHTIVRFPVSCVVAVISFVIINLDISDIINLITGREERVYLSLAAAFLGSGAGHLFAEGRGWPAARGTVLAGAGAALLGVIYFFKDVTAADPMFLFGGTMLLVMTAAYLRKGADERALWLFNARFGLALLLAFVVAVIFCGGISAILASLDYLFDVSVRGTVYEHLWATGATLVGPLYGLSLIPRDLDEPLQFSSPPALVERGISVLINYVLAPMILVYLVILYLYAGKIALAGELPKGQIGIMVLLFGLGGTATFLIARPWAERGTVVLRWFLASWFWLTIVPIVLLVIAVWRRIADYGVTPERYGLVLIALWLAGMVVYFAVRRTHVASRTIMLSLGILLLVSSFGPWGARGLSVSQQLARLEAILSENGYLQNGRLVQTLPQPEKMPIEQSGAGASIVNLLRETESLHVLEPMFDGRADNPFSSGKNLKGWSLASAVNEQLGLRTVASGGRDGGRYVNFGGNQPTTLAVPANSILYGPFSASRFARKADPENPLTPVAVIEDRKVLVITRGPAVWRYDGVMLLKELEQRTRAEKTRYQVYHKDLDGPAGMARLLITSANGQLGGQRDQLNSVQMWLILPEGE
jgi:hypothetical protein